VEIIYYKLYLIMLVGSKINFMIIIKQCLVDRHWLSFLVTFYYVNLSPCPTSSPVVSRCFCHLLFCLWFTIFSNFPFLKMCLMNLDCFFLNSTIILLFSLTCFRMSSLDILSVYGTFNILLQNHISVASSYFLILLIIVQASLP
jgi:hypothetical protein